MRKINKHYREKIKKELDLKIADRENDKQYIEKLNKTKDKIKYLRFVKRYTQSDTAEMIGISTRQVQKVERILKMKGV